MSDIVTSIPGLDDSELAASALRGLDHLIDADGPVRLSLPGDEGDVVVPRSALVALAQVLESFAQGEGVTVIPTRAELTTQQAADALNVSRPFLIGLLNSGEITYRTVGTHRRVTAASLIHYMRADDARRVEAANTLAVEAYSLGMA